MRGFPGQLTQHAGHGSQALVWVLTTPFYLKINFVLNVLKSRIFQVIDA
jgi:hypothetical protein